MGQEIDFEREMGSGEKGHKRQKPCGAHVRQGILHIEKREFQQHRPET